MMEFRLDGAQVELQNTVASFCAGRFPLDAVASREGAVVDRSMWAELAELGVLGLLVPGEAGGIGLGAVEAAIVFEQLGSHLAPGPVAWTLLGGLHVPDVVSGEQLVGGVDAAAVTDGAVVVEHAADIDVLLVVCDDGVFAHRAADLAPPTPLDGLDPLATVGRFAGIGDGEQVGDAAAAIRLRTLGTVLNAAMLVGVSTRSLEVARAYAVERQQFDVAIGSFQAVKHLLADMYVRDACAQSASYAAAAVFDDVDGDPVIAAARAKLLASEAAITNASTAIQVLGGMGFTWDMLPNYLLKRAWVLENEFHATEHHELDVGSALAAA